MLQNEQKQTSDLGKTYFPEVDIVKGIAILLVILGHSFCTFPFDLNSRYPLFTDVVRSFQMQLFFIASGFLFSKNDSIKIFISKKVHRLIIPFLVFGLLSVLLRYTFSSFTHGGSISLLNGICDILQGHYYWFLYSLMWIMTFTLLIKSRFLLATLAVISIICCLVTDVKDENVFTIGRTIYYFPFFILGYLMRQVIPIIKRNELINNFALTSMLGIVYLISLYLENSNKLVSFYIIPILGSAFTWGIAFAFSKVSVITNTLKHFGHYSLQYYLNHLLIMLPVYYVGMFTPPICNY